MDLQNPTKATPVEIDTLLAKLYGEQERAQNEFDRQRRYREVTGYDHHWFDADKLMQAEQQLESLGRKINALDDEYRSRPWPRYFHVTNGNGHIHDSMSCSSCFPTTQYAWRTDLSGLSMEEVVEREAYNACSVCLPIAPAEQKAARQRYNKAQREAKAAERQTKRNEKEAKARARAEKLVDKVEVAIEKLGGREVFETQYSTYGHDGKKSIYDWTFDNCQATVGDVLYDLCQQRAGQRMSHINDTVKAVLTDRGLI